MRARRTTAVITALLVAGLLLVQPGAGASDPSTGTVAQDGDAVSWSGGPFLVSRPLACVSSTDPGCDSFTLTVGDPGAAFSVIVSLAPEAEDDDFTLSAYDYFGLAAEEGTSDGSGGSRTVVLENPEAGDYEVRIRPNRVAPGARYTAVATLAVDGSAGSTAGDPVLIDFERALPGSEGCLEPVPAQASLPTGDRIGLDVLLLLDGVALEDAQSFVALAQEHSYGPAGIELRATFESVAFPADGLVNDQLIGRERETIHFGRLLQLTKEHVGPVRPPGIDLVYTATAKDLYSGSGQNPEDYVVMGYADCIGGVRYDEFAFAVGEAVDTDRFDFGLVSLYRDLSAKVFAHEAGHLMGAHHHYGQCGPQAVNERTVAQGEVTPCTVMAPFIDLISLTMGPVEVAVVHGHADRHAR